MKKQAAVLDYEEYDEILFDCIDNLDKFNYLSGAEGKVYFVNDDFVIKMVKIDEVSGEDISEAYNAYCEEIQSYGEAGLCVPQIYTWHMEQIGRGSYKCYVLQERVHGRRLFESDIANIYSRCESFCTKEEFLAAIKNRFKHKELFGKIVREYMLGFIETNKELLSLDEKVIENFVMSDFTMTKDSVFGRPDVHGENVLFDGETLTIVDNFFGGIPETTKTNEARNIVLKNVILMFYYNEMVKRYAEFNCKLKGEFQKLKEENIELCFQVMQRFLHVVKGSVKPVIYTKQDFDSIMHSTSVPLNDKLAREICREFGF